MTLASSAAVGPPPGMAVRLSSNESPFGPSPAALEAAARVLADAHRYPDDQSLALRAAIAEHEGRDPAEVAVGNGSAAVLMDVVAELCAHGGEVLTYAHAFVVYRLAARNAGARYLEVATGPGARDARDGYARDVDALLAAVGPDTRLVCIDNPGNPTGAHLTGEQLTALAAGLPERVVLLVDEAYHHYAAGQHGYATVAELDLDHPRVLVTRTCSKAHALAGLRVGWVSGPRELVSAVDARRPRFNLTAPAQAAAIASLADHAHLTRGVAATLAGRQRLAAALRAQGVELTEGLGNFVTLELGAPAGPVVEAYAAAGVGVRPLAPYGLHEQVRVSVGTDPEVTAFLEASSVVLPSPGAGAPGDSAT